MYANGVQNIVNEDEPDETTQKAAELMGRLDQLVPMTEPEQLTEPENTESVQPSAEYREALLVLDDTSYLHVQPATPAGTTRSTMWQP